MVKNLFASTKRRVDFPNNPNGYVWWKIKITESKYGYSEATAGFYVVLLVIVALAWFVIRAHSEVGFLFSTRDLPILWFSRMICVCRKSLFNIKKLYSKNTIGIEIFLICSASNSNNHVGLYTFIILFAIYCHLCYNFYSKVIVSSSFTNKLRARWWK